MRATMRWSRAVLFLTGLVILLLPGLVSTTTAQIVRTEDALVALFGLQTDIEVEERLLRREEDRYRENLRSRTLLRRQLEQAYRDLEDLFRQERGEEEEDLPEEELPDPEDVERAAEAQEMEVRALERAQSAAREEGRVIRDQIRRTKARISLISDKIGELQASMPRDAESVTGIWDITIMPGGDRGVFAMWQSGTMVSGQYVLEGPFHGSLEGTLINRQLLIRRIDATLGRSMEFSGYLGEDGQSVQGTWLNYDLSSGRRPTGSWSARKRSSQPSDTSPIILDQTEP